MLAQTRLAQAGLVPEVELHLASELTPIWEATEAALARAGVEPPFWAFAWPGAQAIARHLFDFPALARDRRVLDFAAGCGLAAIAAARVGAVSVEASEIDPVAIVAIALNALANNVSVIPLHVDVLLAPSRWDLILAGDVCYAAPMAARVLSWLHGAAAAGAEVWIADPGRAYLPREGLFPFGPVYDVPVTRELEDRDYRPTRLYRLGQPPAADTGPALASSRRHPTGTSE